MEEEKKPKAEEKQLKDAGKKVSNAGGTMLNAGKSAVDTGKKAVEMAKKATKALAKAPAKIAAIASLFTNPVFWGILTAVLVAILTIALLVTFTYLANIVSNKMTTEEWVNAYETSYEISGTSETASKTVSGEFGKRFMVSQIDIGGPAEVSMNTDGCGPSSIAMALSELADQEVSAIEIAQYGLSAGLYHIGGIGASFGLYQAVAEKYKTDSRYPKLSTLTCTRIDRGTDGSMNTAIQELQNGAQIVCNSRKFLSTRRWACNLFMWI